jgi:hypothetical protein
MLNLNYEAIGNQQGLKMLRKFSSVAWRHIHFLGHYIFSDEKRIDLDRMIEDLLSKQHNSEEK